MTPIHPISHTAAPCIICGRKYDKQCVFLYCNIALCGKRVCMLEHINMDLLLGLSVIFPVLKYDFTLWSGHADVEELRSYINNLTGKEQKSI